MMGINQKIIKVINNLLNYEENKNLKEAYEWAYHENIELKTQIEQHNENFNKKEVISTKESQ